MRNHSKAKRLIETAERILASEDEPHVSEWVDIVEGLKDQLKEYVWLREESES